ncbi:MFS transporter [Pseudomonas fluorescens]|uniref:MFS transporter n=1 Tax=Pseudomonas fluorescens TaxID=294 RepID=UPI000CD1E6B0|nr:MFS transporter [Pseudomonas fluorescens]PNY78786.1 hypothetical protein C1751_01795 [Pseudomonas fluorescens]
MNSKIILASIALIVILAEAEIDIIAPSLPGLMRHYQASAFEAELALSLNLIAHAIAGLWVGTLADRFGRKNILLLGIVTFIFGSALSVFAYNIPVLLLGRILQGAGMSAPTVIGILIAIEGVSKAKQESRMAMLNSIANISLAFTPAVGSMIAVFFGWHANFQFLLIFGAVALLVAVYGVPKNLIRNELDNDEPAIGSYWALVSDPKIRMAIFSTTLLPAGWFTFVGVASIVYVEHFGVSVGEYGSHQGSIALSYGISTLIIYKIAKTFSSSLLVVSSAASVLFAILGLMLGFWSGLYSPLYVTAMILFGSIGSVVLVNKTQLAAINLNPRVAGKVSALISFCRWTLAAIFIQVSGALFYASPTLAFLLISVLWMAGLLVLFLAISQDHQYKELILK